MNTRSLLSLSLGLTLGLTATSVTARAEKTDFLQCADYLTAISAGDFVFKLDGTVGGNAGAAANKGYDRKITGNREQITYTSTVRPDAHHVMTVDRDSSGKVERVTFDDRQSVKLGYRNGLCFVQNIHSLVGGAPSLCPAELTGENYPTVRRRAPFGHRVDVQETCKIRGRTVRPSMPAQYRYSFDADICHDIRKEFTKEGVSGCVDYLKRASKAAERLNPSAALRQAGGDSESAVKNATPMGVMEMIAPCFSSPRLNRMLSDKRIWPDPAPPADAKSSEALPVDAASVR